MSGPGPSGGQEQQNRLKILEDLQQQKKRLQMQTGAPGGPLPAQARGKEASGGTNRGPADARNLDQRQRQALQMMMTVNQTDDGVGGASNARGGATDPGGRAREQMGRAREQMGRAREQMGRAREQMGRANAPVGGTNNPVGGASEQVGGANAPVGGSNDPVGGASELMGGANVPMGGTNNPVGGASELMGGANVPMGGTNHPVGGASEHIGGANAPVGGANNPVGGASETNQEAIDEEGGAVDTDPSVELQKALEFDCGCRSVNSKACIRQFTPEEIVRIRLDLRGLTGGEKDLILLGIFHTAMNTSSSIKYKGPNRSEVKERMRTRSTYTVHAKRVCAAAFRYLHAISRNKLSAVQRWYREHGLTPRRKQSGGRVESKRTLKFEDTSRVAQFIKNFAEEHALAFPGRTQGAKTADRRVLPAPFSKSGIWRNYYRPCMHALGVRAAELSTFRKLWHQLCPHIIFKKTVKKEKPKPAAASKPQQMPHPNQTTAPSVSHTSFTFTTDKCDLPAKCSYPARGSWCLCSWARHFINIAHLHPGVTLIPTPSPTSSLKIPPSETSYFPCCPEFQQTDKREVLPSVT